MKTLNIKIALNWVSEYDVLECALTVPYDVTAYEIVDILQKGDKVLHFCCNI